MPKRLSHGQWLTFIFITSLKIVDDSILPYASTQLSTGQTSLQAGVWKLYVMLLIVVQNIVYLSWIW